MPQDEALPKLGVAAPDAAASAIRGLGSLVPHGGKAIASIIATLVPAQRSSRIDKYLEILDQRISDLEEIQLSIIASSPEHIDLIEEGAFRAARALSEKRIDRIAYIVAVGVTKGTADLAAQKRLLTLLSDLDEHDITVLKWYVMRNRMALDEYEKNHLHLLDFNKMPTTSFSPREEREADALRRAIDNKLMRYGLIEKYEDTSSKVFPTINSERITELGILVLRTAGVVSNAELGLADDAS